MKVLVIGSGGREHALIWKIAEDERVEKIYAAPGNGGIGSLAENLNIEADDIEGLLKFARQEEIDLTVVGPENPLALGLVDSFKAEGLKVFGVDKYEAQLEGSKDFSKNFMEKHGITTAKYKTYTDADSAKLGLEEFSYPVVIKADGLCAGKGVVICEDRDEAVKTIDDILGNKIFGEEGSKIVMEEFLDGIEASLLCLVSHNKIFPLSPAEDYKQIFDGDRGPNTGGVGCYSPSSLLKPKIYKELEDDIIQNIEQAFEKEGMDFTGVLFIGLMVVGDKPYVLEFNVRFGDPETQVVLPRLRSKLVDLFEKTIDGSLRAEDIEWDERPCMTVILTSGGYPGSYEKGFEITGLEDLDEDIIVFHNGSSLKEGRLLTNGGRVLSITAMGDSMEDIREKIYRNIDRLDFNGMYFRKDIGKNISY